MAQAWRIPESDEVCRMFGVFKDPTIACIIIPFCLQGRRVFLDFIKNTRLLSALQWCYTWMHKGLCTFLLWIVLPLIGFVNNYIFVAYGFCILQCMDIGENYVYRMTSYILIVKLYISLTRCFAWCNLLESYRRRVYLSPAHSCSTVALQSCLKLRGGGG